MITEVNWIGWSGALLLMAVLPGLASLSPWLNEPMQFVMMEAFDIMCHQIPERSPHVHGVQLPVCDRCYGILVGLVCGPVVGLIYWKWIYKNERMMVIASMVPLMVDWGLGILNIWSNIPESRFITGFIFGIVAGSLVAYAMSTRRQH